MPLPYLHSPAPSPPHPFPDSLASPRVPVALHAANLGFGTAPSLPPPCPSPSPSCLRTPVRCVPAPARGQDSRRIQPLRTAGGRWIPAPARGRERPSSSYVRQGVGGPCSSCALQGADGPCSSCARQGAAVPAALRQSSPKESRASR